MKPKQLKFIATALTLTLALGSACLHAQTVEVHNAWVRSTVPGQKGTGAFMSLTAQESTRLVGIDSPVAGVAEVHEMKMEGDVMKMRALPGLDLPAGKRVEFKPGSYHVMLMDLKQPLPKDTSVPLVLRFKNAKGVQSQLDLSVPVRTVAPDAGKAHPHGAHSHD
ncbi:MAG: copper chaperone PCu(A)C [Pseudomonadota bacterium]|nr:copper chaperone PCu(A)C [Pseudomonadota bacterium]